MNKIQIESTSLCSYIQHDSGIHEFKYLEATRESWDACMKLLYKLLQQTPKNDMLLIIINAEMGSISLNYAFHKVREWIKITPNPPLTRTVILYKENRMLRIAEAMTRSLYSSKSVTRFFHVTKRQEAVDWLLAQ